MRFCFKCLALASLASAAAFEMPPARAGDDLILPPELRAVPTPPGPPEQRSVPRKPASGTNAKHAKTAAPAAQTQSDSKPAPSQAANGEDPLSFGMKWNASNQPNYGAATTSGLINEVNKNVNGQPVGSGGQVGLKYKF